MMACPRSLIRLAIHVFFVGVLFTCVAQTSTARTLEEVRSSVTIEHAYEFGSQIELVVKKGDVVRLTLNENPSGRKGIFLLPKDDYLQLIIPSIWSVDQFSGVGKKYIHLKDFFREMGPETMLNLKVSEGPNETVAIKLFMDYKKNFSKLLKRGGKRAEHRRKDEEERRRANVISVDERLAGFVQLWSEIKYNFAFFDQVPELNWDKVLEEYLPEIRKEQTTEQYYRLLEQYVARLNDGHTTVYPPGILRHSASLPIRLMAVNRKPIISEVAEAAAFACPELKVGLEITHIDGRPVSEILEKEIYPYEAGGTPQNHDRRAFRRLIQGEKGSEAIVRVRNADGELRDLKLTRLWWWRYPQPPRFEYYNLGEGIAYIALNSFSSNEVSSLFGMVFGKIRQAKGLIVDVRNNGGGSSHHGYAIISRLVDKPIPDSSWNTPQHIAAFEAWGRQEQWYEGGHDMIEPKGGKHYTGPVVVLTGPGTVSAAEDFVVALHASGRATLVGERTAGTTGQPLMIKLPRGGRARICTKRDTYPDGREFVGIGVIPDVEVHPTQESIEAGRDVVLEKAIKVLARQAGIDSIDSAALSGQVASQRRKAPLQESQAKVIAVLEEAKSEYNSLAAAYAKKDWQAVDVYGDNLRDLIRDELLGAFQVGFRRELLGAEGRLNQQAEYDLLKFERRRKEIETFFDEHIDIAKLHRLIYEIEDLSDEVRDCANDGQFDGVHICFPELKKRWKLLLGYMNQE
jgi:C-terminal processing protease CtpA/Prc